MAGETYVPYQRSVDTAEQQAWEDACVRGDYALADHITYRHEHPFAPITYPVRHDIQTPKKLVCDLAIATFNLVAAQETQDDALMEAAEYAVETVQINILADKFSRENPFVN